MTLVLEPLILTASTSGKPTISYQFADSFGMPLPPITFPATTQMAPVYGTLRVLVVAAQFSDINHTVSTDTIKQEFIQQVAPYFSSLSYRAVSMQVDVIGWVRLPNPQAYYGKDCGGSIDSGDCSGQPTSWWIARDAVPRLNNTVNFDNYDYFVFVHSGYGEETTKLRNGSGLTDTVWSVTYFAGVSVQTPEKTLYKLSIVPELEAGGAIPIGVYCHEFAIQLGLPDLYNTQTGLPILGPWDVMDKGTWDGDPPGSSPARMIAWCMIKLGWINGSMLAVASDSTVSNYTVDPIEVASNNVHAVKIPISSQRYYLIEDRQHIGTDEALPSTGVLITYANDQLYLGPVKVIDGHPNIPALQNATWAVGQVFKDEQNNIAVSIDAQIGNAFQITVNRVGPMPDLAVDKIFTKPTAVTPNTTVTIYADITNQGTADASNVPVQVLIDGQIYATKQVTLAANETTEVSVDWTAVSGSHIVKVIVDPDNTITELSRAKNTGTYTLNVGPTVIITVPLNITSTNVTAWVKINGVQYQVDATNRISTTVSPGPTTIEAQPEIYLMNGTRQEFVDWSDGNTQNPRQITVTNNTSLHAVYKLQYRLSIDPNGGVATPGGWYDANDNVTVVAVSPSNTTEVSRLIFTDWSGSTNSTAPSITITLSKPVTLKANWKRQYYVDVTSPVGSATGTGWYDTGSSATISIQAPVITQNNVQHIFTGWNGITDTQTARTIIVNSAEFFQATWRTQYLVQVKSTYGVPHGSGWYDANSIAHISIPPEIDYANQTRRMFLGWSGDYFGNVPSVTLNVNSPKSFTANWQTQYQLTFRVEGIPNGTHIELNLGNTSYDLSSDYRGWFNAGTQINPAINGTINAGVIQYQMVGWRNPTGGAVQPPFNIHSPETYIASYQPALPSLSLPIPGFPDESIILGLATGLALLLIVHRRKQQGT